MYKEIENLLDSSRKGDKKATEELLFRLNPLIISSIKRYYNRIDRYDDLIQEGYVMILQSINDYDSNKGAYFLGYVKLNLKYHYLNKHKEKQTLSLNEPIGDGFNEILDFIEVEEKGPIDMVIYKEDFLSLYECLNFLSHRQRQIIIEYYINELSLDEIAKKLGISYRTVANTKTAGINKLKNILVK